MRAATTGILAYCSLVTAAAFAAPLLGGTPNSPGPGLFVWALAPLAVAIVLRTVARDWGDTGFRPRFRENLGWYALSLVGFPLAMAIALLLGNVLSVSPLADLALPTYVTTVAQAFIFFFIFAIFEEVGWRGYLQPKLSAAGVNDFLGYGIVGAVWATWHLPYLRDLTWVYSSEDLLTFVPRLYLGAIAFSILYGELRTITGSVWPAVLLHAMSNAVGHPLAASALRMIPGTEPIASIGFDGIVMMVVFASLGLGIRFLRKRRRDSGQL